MADVTTVDELRERLKRMSPQQLKHVVRMGKLHAKLVKQSRKPHGLSATQTKILAKINQTRLGI
jgi:hypothetical protein